MNDDIGIISGFSGSVDNEAPFAVDFVAARQLNVSGSTCDVYECTVQRRRVFVKRLKAEYRNNPLYRAAFSKEFDLGVSFSHPSLPRYVGFGGDYIMIDFIEGDTLADLIKRHDSRLKDKGFVRKLLRELIDVTEYLHNRNIVHCDIKPDNIIISPYPDRPTALIDFDKAYSPWLDSTHGNTEKYGCNGCADGAIDFKGIGLIAERLGNKKMAKACGKKGVTVDLLKKALDNSAARRAVIWLIAVGMVAGVAGLSLYEGMTTDKEVSVPAAESAKMAEKPAEPVQESAARRLAAPQKPTVDNAWISSLIREKSTEIDGHRQKLLEILDCDTISAWDKNDAIYNYTYSSGLATSGIIYSAVRHFRNINELDVQYAVRSNPAWIRLTEEETEMQSWINDWRIKASRHSSDRPASPHDTVRDVPHPAQHR